MHGAVTLKIGAADTTRGRDALCIGVFGESGR